MTVKNSSLNIFHCRAGDQSAPHGGGHLQSVGCWVSRGVTFSHFLQSHNRTPLDTVFEQTQWMFSD